MRNSNSHTRTVKTKLNKSKNIFRAYNDIQFKHGNPESKVLRGRDQRREQLLRLHPFHPRENHYLFTGDLEKEGEASLVEMNQLPEVELFKGGHHGSYTANTDALLSVIQPKTVCICCCAGSTEYTKNPLNTFPAQDAITRIAKYTEKVYVTSLVDETSEKGYQPFNGTITCSSIAGLGIDDLEIQCSHSNVILKDSEWFKANRTWPNAT